MLVCAGPRTALAANARDHHPAVFERATRQAVPNAGEGIDPRHVDHCVNLLVLLAQRSRRLLQAKEMIALNRLPVV